jgi:Holliday junction resolvase
MTSGYVQGRNVEWAARSHLIENGYEVIRGSSSKGFADLCAIKPGQVLVISCKRTTMPGPAERVELLRVAACLPGVAVPLVALKPARKPLEYRRLTGPGPREWVPWDADEAAHEQMDVVDDGRDDDPWRA